MGSAEKYEAEIKGEMYFQIWQNSIFQQFADYHLGKPVAFILLHSVIEHYFFNCFWRFIAY